MASPLPELAPSASTEDGGGDRTSLRGRSRTAAAGSRIDASNLLAALVFAGGVQNLLLLRFLGVGNIPVFAVGSLALLATTFFVAKLRIGSADTHPTLLRFAACVGISAIIFLLGGEGRFFYANLDWQVRDAVMNDMLQNPWPFAYFSRGTAEILRAPIGMYILPSLAGKLGGMPAADIGLLVQNALMLGVLLTLASMLFKTFRSRLTALAVFAIFSGMDFLGQILVSPAAALSPVSHIDWWAGIQYSSTATLAFWVPQHALAGWLGAVLFLLWRRGLLPLAGFYAPLPLMALWSPLALLGVVPFAAFAGFNTLLARRLTLADFLLPLATTFLSLASLAYLQAGSETVGSGTNPLSLRLYFVFQLLEIIPYLLALWLLPRNETFGRDGLLIATVCLLIFPFIQIGPSADFMMRASIPALAILALLVSEALARPRAEAVGIRKAARAMLTVTLLIGSITPAHEVMRALAMRPTPYPECSLLASADRSILVRSVHAKSDEPLTHSTYVAAADALPAVLRSKKLHPVPADKAGDCWSRPWLERRF
jgi:hypothetical protein